VRVEFGCLTPAHFLREEKENSISQQSDCGGRGSISAQSILDLWQKVLTVQQAAAMSSAFHCQLQLNEIIAIR
jgi:hypothetical protein